MYSHGEAVANSLVGHPQVTHQNGLIPSFCVDASDEPQLTLQFAGFPTLPSKPAVWQPLVCRHSWAGAQFQQT